MNIRAVGTELFNEDGRTDMTKLTVAFRNFTNAPKKRRNPILNSQNDISLAPM